MNNYKDIPGYEGFYKANKNGDIYDILRNIVMKKTISTNGYEVVRLRKNKNNKVCTVHRLIAKTFLKNKNMMPCVNHKDLNKANNNLNNLEWCTYKHNSRHAVINGSGGTKRVLRLSIDLDVLEEYESLTSASIKTGILLSVISRACSEIGRTAGGFIWIRKNEYDPKMKIKVKSKYKKVLQYNLNGQLIAKYKSRKDAINKTGIDGASITRCCNGRYEQAGGYVWKYE